MPKWVLGLGAVVVAAVLIVVVVARRSPVEPGPAAPSGPEKATADAGAGKDMVLVKAGSFTMGSERGGADEGPAHKVSVDAFYIDKFEVTQEAYEKLMGKNPSKNKDAKCPVERVRWSDAAQFCNERSKRDGLKPCYRQIKQGKEETWESDLDADGYRLPTEAEWEYACRAGTDTDYCFGGSDRELGKYAWHAANSGSQTHQVGQKQPNAWGLYDMHGNVWEWINDFYAAESYKESPDKNPRGPKSGLGLMRGGSFKDSADSCRSSYRKYNDDEEQALVCAAYEHLGFRCVRPAKGK